MRERERTLHLGIFCHDSKIILVSNWSFTSPEPRHARVTWIHWSRSVQLPKSPLAEVVKSFVLKVNVASGQRLNSRQGHKAPLLLIPMESWKAAKNSISSSFYKGASTWLKYLSQRFFKVLQNQGQSSRTRLATAWPWIELNFAALSFLSLLSSHLLSFDLTVSLPPNCSSNILPAAGLHYHIVGKVVGAFANSIGSHRESQFLWLWMNECMNEQF